MHSQNAAEKDVSLSGKQLAQPNCAVLASQATRQHHWPPGKQASPRSRQEQESSSSSSTLHGGR
jgi:hypothetical protein